MMVGAVGTGLKAGAWTLPLQMAAVAASNSIYICQPGRRRAPHASPIIPKNSTSCGGFGGRQPPEKIFEFGLVLGPGFALFQAHVLHDPVVLHIKTLLIIVIDTVRFILGSVGRGKLLLNPFAGLALLRGDCLAVRWPKHIWAGDPSKFFLNV